jgi:formamidopyrimidine-DNA glycosylase
MPELPDILVYIESLTPRVQGQILERVRLGSPFVLRTVDPPLEDAAGRRVTGLRRIGKRIVFALEGDLFLVFHLMIAGRFHWKPAGAAVSKRAGLAACDFSTGTLLLTEASQKKRAALHCVAGEEALAQFERGGVEPLETDARGFRAALTRENHTLKRALTDPRLFSGIGNAYSDEILHRARLSPFKLSRSLSADEIERLYESARGVLREWIERLRAETGDGFPEKVTAFRPEMAVHGRYRQPCPVCATPVQRVVYAENECNYCPICQTEGRLLADRALSRLLKGDWPRTAAQLEEQLGRPQG